MVPTNDYDDYSKIKDDYSSIVIPQEPPLSKKKYMKWQKRNLQLMNLDPKQISKFEAFYGIPVITSQARMLSITNELESQYSHDELRKLIKSQKVGQVMELMVKNKDYELILLALDSLKDIKESELFLLLNHILDIGFDDILPLKPYHQLEEKRIETINEKLLHKIFGYPTQRLEWIRLLSTLSIESLGQLLQFIHFKLLDETKFPLWYLWYDYPFLDQHRAYFDQQYTNHVANLQMLEQIIDSNLFNIKQSKDLSVMLMEIKSQLKQDSAVWTMMDSRLRGPLDMLFGPKVTREKGCKDYVVEVLEL